jgi:methylenetetrahydrofolate--tRNA-(uracil-5-)-methyltransferase
MKPVGFADPKTGKRPYALVQLRAENAAGSLYNIVGFQTNLKFGEQKRVFSLIPGLENADFVRYGVMHRNSFLNSPEVLNADFSMKSEPNIFFAGQITGVEGYMESAASGIIAGINAAKLERGGCLDRGERFERGEPPFVPPEETMIGALCRYIASQNANFQPMGASMGLLPELPERIRDKAVKYQMLAERAMGAYEKIA